MRNSREPQTGVIYLTKETRRGHVAWIFTSEKEIDLAKMALPFAIHCRKEQNFFQHTGDHNIYSQTRQTDMAIVCSSL